jgi:hypothetical protein
MPRPSSLPAVSLRTLKLGCLKKRCRPPPPVLAVTVVGNAPNFVSSRRSLLFPP